MKKEKHLIIGAGQIGRSLYNVLRPYYEVFLRDKDDNFEGHFDILHICYPPSRNFTRITKKYIHQYKPNLIIIHATVPVGTTRKISPLAVHSPIRGVHPRLEAGIKTFVKYFGGEKAKQTAKIFSSIGVKTRIFKKPETAELLKILDTTYYGWNIVFCKEVKKICEKLKLDFDEVYTIANLDYNNGYSKLRKSNVIRPILKQIPGKIGGHCVIPNCDLLDNWLTNTIKKRNNNY